MKMKSFECDHFYNKCLTITRMDLWEHRYSCGFPDLNILFK